MKVITFSRTFPAKHPKAGQETGFVEKIWSSLIESELISLSKCCELSRNTGIGNLNMNCIRQWKPEPKNHTIRAGNRWKVGEWFSPRVWSSKPYASKQIEFAPPIQIKKIWNVEKDSDSGDFYLNDEYLFQDDIKAIAKNDGLEYWDFMNWFQKPFKGQVICWNESVNYCPIVLQNDELSVAIKF